MKTNRGENKDFFSFVFDSAHVKHGVWPWPNHPCTLYKLQNLQTVLSWRRGQSSCFLTGKALGSIGQLFSFETALNIYGKVLVIPKPISDGKSKKNIPNVLCLQTFQMASTSSATGNSLAARRVSPGRLMAVLLVWAKYVAPCQIKPKILNWSNRRGQQN